MLDWDDLRFFLGVLRAGSQSAAARRLGVDQSTVGRRVAALERRLGARLLTRTPGGLVLTAAGETIRASAERVEEAVLALERASAGIDPDAQPQGTVKLASTDALSRGFVLPALARLRKTHPGIRVELATAPHSVDLLRREADLALRTVHPRAAELIARKVGQIHHALYASRGFWKGRARPRPGRGFDGHDLLLMTPEILPAQARQAVGEPIETGRVVLQANNVTSLVEAARLGMGIAPLPTYLADPDPLLERVWPDREEPTELWLVVHKDVRQAARVRAVIDAISAQLALPPEPVPAPPRAKAGKGRSAKRARGAG